MTRETANRAAPRQPSGIRGLGVVLALTGALCLGPVNGLVASGAVASAQTVVGDRSDTSSSTDRADPGQSAAARRSGLAVIVALGTGFVMTAGGKAYRLRRLQQGTTRGPPDEGASSAPLPDPHLRSARRYPRQ